MTADINVILQLLQRQMAPVPPAYSSVSASGLPTESSVLHSMFTISPLQMDSRVPTQVQKRTETSPCDSDLVSVLTLALNGPNGISLLQSSPHTDVKFTGKSQESISSGSHVTAPPADATLMAVTPETERHAGSLPQMLQPLVKASAQKPELCRVPHCPSLPGNLDLASGPTQLQKHLSEPVLPVIPRESGAASGLWVRQSSQAER